MNEVEKMYRNAKLTNLYCGDDYVAERMLEFECTDGNKEKCKTCDKAKINYPPFTAEKQLELIKLLSKVTLADYFQFFFYEIKEEWVFRLFMITEMSCESAYTYESRNKDFTEALAGLVNHLWQDLTDAERKQIKEILENGWRTDR